MAERSNYNLEAATTEVNGQQQQGSLLLFGIDKGRPLLGTSSHLLLLFALLVMINLIVILGNILVILAVYLTAKLRSVTNIFIVSLATADLMLGVFVLPYALLFEIFDVWMFGEIWCRGWLVTDVWISTASILNLCAISVDRYVAVTRPVKYRSIMTTRRAKTIVAFVWIVSFLICFPPLLPKWNPSGSSSSSSLPPLASQSSSASPPLSMVRSATAAAAVSASDISRQQQQQRMMITKQRQRRSVPPTGRQLAMEFAANLAPPAANDKRSSLKEAESLLLLLSLLEEPIEASCWPIETKPSSRLDTWPKPAIVLGINESPPATTNDTTRGSSGRTGSPRSPSSMAATTNNNNNNKGHRYRSNGDFSKRVASISGAATNDVDDDESGGPLVREPSSRKQLGATVKGKEQQQQQPNRGKTITEIDSNEQPVCRRCCCCLCSCCCYRPCPAKGLLESSSTASAVEAKEGLAGKEMPANILLAGQLARLSAFKRQRKGKALGEIHSAAFIVSASGNHHRYNNNNYHYYYDNSGGGSSVTNFHWLERILAEEELQMQRRQHETTTTKGEKVVSPLKSVMSELNPSAALQDSQRSPLPAWVSLRWFGQLQRRPQRLAAPKDTQAKEAGQAAAAAAEIRQPEANILKTIELLLLLLTGCPRRCAQPDSQTNTTTTTEVAACERHSEHRFGVVISRKQDGNDSSSFVDLSLDLSSQVLRQRRRFAATPTHQLDVFIFIFSPKRKPIRFSSKQENSSNLTVAARTEGALWRTIGVQIEVKRNSPAAEHTRGFSIGEAAIFQSNTKLPILNCEGPLCSPGSGVSTDGSSSSGSGVIMFGDKLPLALRTQRIDFAPDKAFFIRWNNASTSLFQAPFNFGCFWHCCNDAFCNQCRLIRKQHTQSQTTTTTANDGGLAYGCIKGKDDDEGESAGSCRCRCRIRPHRMATNANANRTNRTKRDSNRDQLKQQQPERGEPPSTTRRRAQRKRRLLQQAREEKVGGEKSNNDGLSRPPPRPEVDRSSARVGATASANGEFHQPHERANLEETVHEESRLTKAAAAAAKDSRAGFVINGTRAAASGGGKTGCALFDDKPYVIYSSLGSFYIPMLIMIFFYSRIYLVASRAQKAIQRGYMTTKWSPRHMRTGSANKAAAAGIKSKVQAAVPLKLPSGGGQANNNKNGTSSIENSSSYEPTTTQVNSASFSQPETNLTTTTTAAVAVAATEPLKPGAGTSHLTTFRSSSTIAPGLANDGRLVTLRIHKREKRPAANPNLALQSSTATTTIARPAEVGCPTRATKGEIVGENQPSELVAPIRAEIKLAAESVKPTPEEDSLEHSVKDDDDDGAKGGESNRARTNYNQEEPRLEGGNGQVLDEAEPPPTLPGAPMVATDEAASCQMTTIDNPSHHRNHHHHHHQHHHHHYSDHHLRSHNNHNHHHHRHQHHHHHRHQHHHQRRQRHHNNHQSYGAQTKEDELSSCRSSRRHPQLAGGGDKLNCSRVDCSRCKRRRQRSQIKGANLSSCGELLAPTLKPPVIEGSLVPGKGDDNYMAVSQNSVNSVQITISQFEEDEDQSKLVAEHYEISRDKRTSANNKRLEFVLSPTPESAIAGNEKEEEPNKSERSKSVDVCFKHSTNNVDPDTDTAVSNMMMLSGDDNQLLPGRTDRSQSCGPTTTMTTIATPTIVVNWIAETGSHQCELLASASAAEKCRAELRTKANDQSHHHHGLMVSLPQAANQVRKQSMMLLSSLTSRSSQTLRRLSMVASHPVDSLLANLHVGRSRDTIDDSRDSSSDCSQSSSLSRSSSSSSSSRSSSSSSSADSRSAVSASSAEDEGQTTGERPRGELKRMRKGHNKMKKRKRRNRSRRRRRDKSGEGPKRTFDDYLMAVAGIDGSSSPSDVEDGDDDDDFEDDEAFTSSDNNNNCRTGTELQQPRYSLFLGRQASPVPASSELVASNELNSGAAVCSGLELESGSKLKLGPADLAETPAISTSANASGNSQPLQICSQTKNNNNSSSSNHKELTQQLELARPEVERPSALHRQGAYYERATSRDGQQQQHIQPSKENVAKSLLVVTTAKDRVSTGTGQQRGSMTAVTKVIRNSLNSVKAPENSLRISFGGGNQQFGGGGSGGGGRTRRRGAKRTSRWHAKRLHAETKAAKTVAIIIGGFIFCWLPFFTAYLSRAIICERPDCIPQSLLSLFIWLGYLNSAINPVIYGLFSADFRHAFKNIVCRCRFRGTDEPATVSILVDSIINSIL